MEGPSCDTKRNGPTAGRIGFLKEENGHGHDCKDPSSFSACLVALWLAEAPLHRHTYSLEHVVQPDNLAPHSHLAYSVNRFLDDNSLAFMAFPRVAVPSVCVEMSMHGDCVFHLAGCSKKSVVIRYLKRSTFNTWGYGDK